MDLIERFLKYVQIDTESMPESTLTPSTLKQKDLGRILVEECYDERRRYCLCLVEIKP